MYCPKPKPKPNLNPKTCESDAKQIKLLFVHFSKLLEEYKLKTFNHKSILVFNWMNSLGFKFELQKIILCRHP